MKSVYWEYLRSHPSGCHHELGEGVKTQAEDILAWNFADQSMYLTLSSSFNKEQCKELLEHLRSLPDPLSRLAGEQSQRLAIQFLMVMIGPIRDHTIAVRTCLVSAIMGTISEKFPLA